MKTAHSARWLVGSALLLIAVLALFYLERHQYAPPDFLAASAGDPRKQVFFAYLLPLVGKANSAIASQRAELEAIAQLEELSGRPLRRLERLAAAYGLDPADMQPQALLAEALLRVDEIPPALILAQAAKESGWGTSRFAANANNFFGQRCWETDCGVMPEQRPAGATYEVASFENPYESLQSYLYNLNTHPEYATLRAVRHEARQQGKQASGLLLAEHLYAYSERRQAYIDDIKSIITANQLESTP